MPAYWVARAKITDPAQYKKYTDLVPAIIAKHGGKVLARGGRYKINEGPHDFHRFVVIEFPQVVFHDGTRQTLSRIGPRNIKIAKRGQAVLATIDAVYVFLTTGRAVHKAEVRCQMSEVRSQKSEVRSVNFDLDLCQEESWSYQVEKHKSRRFKAPSQKSKVLSTKY